MVKIASMSKIEIRKILVARLRHHGDLLLTTPVFSALKKAYPKAQIDAYIYSETFPILEGNPYVDDYILYQKRKWPNFFKKIAYEIGILFKIRRGCYDLVINLTEGDRGAIAALVSKAKIRIGIDPEGSGMLAKKWCFTHLSKRCHQIRHTVERQLDVLRTLDIFPSYDERNLFFHISDATISKMDAMLKEKKIKDFILIHPVSRWLFKCLPVATIKEIVAFINNCGFVVILSGSNDAKETLMNQQIADGFDENSVVNLTGELNLKELGALISLSKLLICVDSLPLHLASALQAKVLAIFGPTSEKTWAPWKNPHAKVIYQDYTCRPCYMPGCAHSKKSDCLETFPSKKICEEIKTFLEDELFT